MCLQVNRSSLYLFIDCGKPIHPLCWVCCHGNGVYRDGSLLAAVGLGTLSKVCGGSLNIWKPLSCCIQKLRLCYFGWLNLIALKPC